MKGFVLTILKKIFKKIFNFLNKENIIDEVYSSNKKVSAISILEDGNINIYKNNIFFKKINNEEKYKKILSIDNKANVLYVSINSYPHHANRSRIFFNEQPLDVDIGVHASALNYENIFVWKFFHYHLKENKFWIYLYNSKLHQTRSIDLGNKFPEKIFFLDKENLYIETFDGIKSKSFILDLVDLTLNISHKTNDSNSSQKKELIVKSNNMSQEQLQLINYFNEEFASNDPNGVLSSLDNYEGRLSWYISKKLEALINILELKKKNLISLSEHFDLESIINKYIINILKLHEKVDNKSGWPTKKYSINKKTKLFLSVNNSTIFYPLLLSINSGKTNNLKTKKIIELFDDFFRSHEKNFLNKKNIYIINNNNFSFRGVEPINFQSQFGLCLIEAYKATKDTKYFDRLLLLSNSIKTQVVVLENNSLIWPYHYCENYNSLLNLVEKAEDVSHASFNMNFLLESSNLLGKNFYFDDLKDKLNNTLNRIIHLNELKFNRRLSDNSEKSYKFLPKSYWLKLDNKKLNFIHHKNLIIQDNYFENSRLLTFSIMIKNSFK